MISTQAVVSLTTALLGVVWAVWHWQKEHWCRRHRRLYHTPLCPACVEYSVEMQRRRDAVGEDSGTRWQWPLTPQVAVNDTGQFRYMELIDRICEQIRQEVTR